MPTEVTITLDSGFFMPMKGSSCEIGYFQCEGKTSDITVSVDGELQEQKDPLKLGTGCCTVQVHHKDRDGTTRNDGITIPVPFHHNLLHLNELYDDEVQIDRMKFDCILRFESGELHPKDVRPRKFHRFRELPDLTLSLAGLETKESKAIAHDVYFRFTLEDGESIELTRDGAPFWSSKGLTVEKSLDITIGVDRKSTDKFYRYCLAGTRDTYWMPNPDPPPACPNPPCLVGGGPDPNG